MDIYYYYSGIEKNLMYKINYFKKTKQISPWHDINYKEKNGLYNMIIEIPKFSKEKIEMSKYDEYNPLKFDIVNNLPRMYHMPIYWNYGFVPQTWENPNLLQFGYIGDNDPLDILEIGNNILELGSIQQVKILGSIAMIDQNEYDWKIISISNKDTHFQNINNIHDIEEYYPHTLSGIREWFRWYKVPDKKPLNTFELEEKFQNKEFSEMVIEDTHIEWMKAYEL